MASFWVSMLAFGSVNRTIPTWRISFCLGGFIVGGLGGETSNFHPDPWGSICVVQPPPSIHSGKMAVEKYLCFCLEINNPGCCIFDEVGFTVVVYLGHFVRDM